MKKERGKPSFRDQVSWGFVTDRFASQNPLKWSPFGAWNRVQGGHLFWPPILFDEFILEVDGNFWCPFDRRNWGESPPINNLGKNLCCNLRSSRKVLPCKRQGIFFPYTIKMIEKHWSYPSNVIWLLKALAWTRRYRVWGQVLWCIFLLQVHTLIPFNSQTYQFFELCFH